MKAIEIKIHEVEGSGGLRGNPLRMRLFHLEGILAIIVVVCLIFYDQVAELVLIESDCGSVGDSYVQGHRLTLLSQFHRLMSHGHELAGNA